MRELNVKETQEVSGGFDHLPYNPKYPEERKWWVDPLTGRLKIFP